MTELKHPWALGLLLVPLLLAVLAFLGRDRIPTVALPTVAAVRAASRSLRTRLVGLPRLLRMAALAALALGVARPRLGERYQDVVTHGIDIVIALDVSGSMKAEDLRPRNRLHVAKQVVQQFIDSREGDRVGLAVFAGKALTQCPLTTDYGLLKAIVAGIDFDVVDEDGTAIGMGIATAVNRLRQSTARSRVVILVTDGINNRGAIDPFTAAAMAKALGIKVYTVGVGTRGAAPIPVQTAFGTQYVLEHLPLDDEALTRIADETGGFYFRATDAVEFAEALKRIGDLEKTRVETREYVTYDELFAPLVTLAAVLLGLEGMLAATWLRRLP